MQRNAARCDVRDAGGARLGAYVIFKKDDARLPIDLFIQCSHCHRNAIPKARACNAAFHREGVQKEIQVTTCARSLFRLSLVTRDSSDARSNRVRALVFSSLALVLSISSLAHSLTRYR